MNTTTFVQDDVYSGNLLLVNAAHPLKGPEKSREEPLVLLEETAQRQVRLCAGAAKMMRYLLAASQTPEENKPLLPVSGYRSQSEQARLFEGSLRKFGEEYTRRFVALPGCSEHQTGLALDLADGEEGADAICPSFPGDGASGRFKRLCALYGFVERYPNNKTHITGIGYEPWHFRYVGWPHAKIMRQRGLTLEEYITLLDEHRSYSSALVHCENSYGIRIFTLKPGKAGQAVLRLPKGTIWQASGNNVDGVVITIWE